MARAVAERVWRESAPGAIELDLAALWRELAEGGAPIARAVMSNLIVYRCRVPDAVGAVTSELPLDEVAARHPSRVIVLDHDRDRSDPDTALSAAVAIVTFGPPHARYGIEQIIFRSACGEPALLSILRRFVRGDVPTSVWWIEDLSAAPPLDALLTVGRQLIYDSRVWRDIRAGVAALAPLLESKRVDLADLNWRRLAPLRRALVHVRGPVAADRWQAPVRIAYGPGNEPIGWLFAGWLRSQRDAPKEALPAIEPGGDPDVLLTVVIEDMTATLTSRAVEIVSRSAPRLTIGVPIEGDAEAVAGELRSLSNDPALIAALNELMRQFR